MVSRLRRPLDFSGVKGMDVINEGERAKSYLHNGNGRTNAEYLAMGFMVLYLNRDGTSCSVQAQ